MKWIFSIWLAIIVLQGALIAVVFSPEFVKGQQKSEISSVRAVIGGKAEAKIQASTRATFHKWFVKSGFIAGFYKTFIPTEEEKARSRGLEDFGGEAFPWVEKRFKVFLEVMKGAIYRFYYLLLVMPHVLPVLLVGLIDGLVKRQEKKELFGYANPNYYHFAKYLIFGSIVSPFVLAFLPLGINPYLFTVWFLVLPFVIWLGVSNVQHFTGD